MEAEEVCSDNDQQLESDDEESDSEDLEEQTDDEEESQELQPEENLTCICDNNNDDIEGLESQANDDSISENDTHIEHPNDQCNCPLCHLATRKKWSVSNPLSS